MALPYFKPKQVHLFYPMSFFSIKSLQWLSTAFTIKHFLLIAVLRPCVTLLQLISSTTQASLPSLLQPACLLAVPGTHQSPLPSGHLLFPSSLNSWLITIQVSAEVISSETFPRFPPPHSMYSLF